MSWRLACALLLLGAGCLDVPQTSPPEDLLQLQERAHGVLQERLDDPDIEWAWSLSDPVLVEVHGVEGPADWERLEQVPIEELLHAPQIKFAAIHGKYFPEDLHDDNATDGDLPSWSFRYLAERNPGSFWPLTIDWSREHGFGGLSGSYGSGDGWQVCQRPGPHAWQIDATQAAKAARSDPQFAAHLSAHPDGEMWMTLQFAPEFQRFGSVADGCLEFSPAWHVRWMDVDLLFDAGAPWVETRIDASTGALTATHEGMIKLRSAYDVVTLHDETHVFGAGLPARIELGTVPARSFSLTVQVDPSASGGSAAYRLEGPDGSVVHAMLSSYRLFHVQEPLPGDWALVRDGTDVQLIHPEVRHVTAKVLV